MSDHIALLASLPPETRASLNAKENATGLRHLAIHFSAVLAFAGYIAAGLPLWPLAILPLGVLLAFLFTLQHECTHRTPFASPWLNEGVGVITGVLLFQPFYWFRAFHMAHHKHTNDPRHDPELQGDAKPETCAELIWHLSTLGYWADKVTTLMGNAFGENTSPYLNARNRSKIKKEARAMLALYAAFFFAIVFANTLLVWVWLLPLATGFPFLRLYLLAEHGRCPQVSNMFANSRTTQTTKLIRFLAWNMPYHAEHHAAPNVPFHKLPALHALAKPHLMALSPGYLHFSKTYAETLTKR